MGIWSQKKVKISSRSLEHGETKVIIFHFFFLLKKAHNLMQISAIFFSISKKKGTKINFNHFFENQTICQEHNFFKKPLMTCDFDNVLQIRSKVPCPNFTKKY